MTKRITACIPYYQTRRYVRRAVESLLLQRHRDLTVVVVNDGDPDPPWRELAHINDRRLVRISLPYNYGPYFATAAVLNASPDEYFLIQDADDWSDENRISQLLRVIEHDCSDFAVSRQWWYVEQADGKHRPSDNRKGGMVDGASSPALRYRFPHHGLWRTRSLRMLGGYYGGFRVSYDVLLTNLVLLTGKVSYVAAPLYHYLIRRGSLTTSGTTGLASPLRAAVWKTISPIYERAYAWQVAMNDCQITSNQLMEWIRQSCRQYVDSTSLAALSDASERVAYALRSAR
ncbi:MAG TPA: glycosyltransferase family 2 protein [Thermoanaerobaculia bacterium]|nr:glycosyltransferase family 2 protein [Thermoanaerobaculia bacterium]